MNLLQAKNKTLQLIREYTNNGAVIGIGDNADYLKSINALISDSQYEISEKRPIINQYVLPQNPTRVSAKYNRYSLPNDYKLVLGMTKDDVEYKIYKVQNKELLLPKDITGEFVLIYEKYPLTLDETTQDTYELEIDQDVQHITCYKAASHIIIDENPDISTMLKEEYKRQLYSIIPRDFEQQNEIDTTYGGLV